MCYLNSATTVGDQAPPSLVGTVSEEMGGLLGARHLASRLQDDGHHIDRMIIAEPTMCAPVHGHKGGVGLEICVTDTPHTHRALSLAPTQLQQLPASSRPRRRAIALDTLDAATAVGRGTVSVTEIGGGVARNIIPDLCTLYAGRRIAPGEDLLAVYEALKLLLSRLASRCKSMSKWQTAPRFRLLYRPSR